MTDSFDLEWAEYHPPRMEQAKTVRWTPDELRETFGDNPNCVVMQLLTRAERFLAEIERLREENERLRAERRKYDDR